MDLELRSCLAQHHSNGDDGVQAVLELGRMPRPEEGAEPVLLGAAQEHKEQEHSVRREECAIGIIMDANAPSGSSWTQEQA